MFDKEPLGSRSQSCRAVVAIKTDVMDAIIDITDTGSTERYVKRTAQKMGIPAHSLAEAQKAVSANAEVIAARKELLLVQLI